MFGLSLIEGWDVVYLSCPTMYTCFLRPDHPMSKAIEDIGVFCERRIDDAIGRNRSGGWIRDLAGSGGERD